jgi:hypothetical protein
MQNILHVQVSQVLKEKCIGSIVAFLALLINSFRIPGRKEQPPPPDTESASGTMGFPGSPAGMRHPCLYNLRAIDNVAVIEVSY